jgi:hypothetical protein
MAAIPHLEIDFQEIDYPTTDGQPMAETDTYKLWEEGRAGGERAASCYPAASARSGCREKGVRQSSCSNQSPNPYRESGALNGAPRFRSQQNVPQPCLLE